MGNKSVITLLLAQFSSREEGIQHMAAFKQSSNLELTQLQVIIRDG
jgi:hypothetical protein